jgi:CRISPR-associated protein Cas5h
MQTHVFEVSGPYALFRKPYAPVSPVSFPFPPPPTVMGMIGAICGYGKEEYLERVGWDGLRVGISIRSQTQRFRTGINLLNTKEGNFYDAAGRNQRIQIPHEFLKDARFRFYVANGPEAMMRDLGDHLEAGTTTYTLSLGLSECLAELEHLETVEAEPLGEDTHDIDTVVLEDEVDRIEYDADNEYGHYRIPHRMAPGRNVERYSVAVAEETASPIRARMDNAYRVGEDRVQFL